MMQDSEGLDFGERRKYLGTLWKLEEKVTE